jgi:ABC-type transport system involved in multi-copper enzyme maturation permease subunit
MSATVVLETLRRHFAHIAYVGAVLAVMVLAASLGAMNAPVTAVYGPFSLFVILAGCQLIGPEFSKGTLQLILSKPIHRSSYLLARVAGVVIALWIAVALTFAADTIARSIGGHDFSWIEAGSAAVSAAANALLTCSMLALFGSITRSYLNVAIYLGGKIVISLIAGMFEAIQRATRGVWGTIGGFLRVHPGVIGGVRAVYRNLYPDDPSVAFDRNWLLMVVSNAAVALLLACVLFRRREVPYGAD